MYVPLNTDLTKSHRFSHSIALNNNNYKGNRKVQTSTKVKCHNVSESETTFVEPPHESDPLQNVMCSPLAHATPSMEIKPVVFV